MASTIVTVEAALQILAQIVPLIQSAVATGQPIDATAWSLAIGDRNAALTQLDADIAAKEGHST